MKRKPLDTSELVEQIYQHVLRAIDFDALCGLDQMISSVLDQGGCHDETGQLAGQLLTAALVRATMAEERYCSDIPPGITKEEARAAAFDESCPFCLAEDAVKPAADAHCHGDGHDCPLCDDMAREWRAEHAEALRRRGLMPPGN